MTFIILSEPADETAVRVALHLRRRHGADRVQIRTGEELLLATWEHVVCNDNVRTRIRLHDGAELDSCETAVIFNRLRTTDPPAFAAASPVNLAYARMETFALLLSWLHSQRRVVNPATAAALAGCGLRPVVWQQLAAQCGFETVLFGATTSTRRFPYAAGAIPRPDLSGHGASLSGYGSPNRFTWYSETETASQSSFLIIGDRVHGEVSAETAAAGIRLARRAGLDLVRIELAGGKSSSAGLFLTADPLPVISEGEAMRDLVSYLEGFEYGREGAA